MGDDFGEPFFPNSALDGNAQCISLWEVIKSISVESEGTEDARLR